MRSPPPSARRSREARTLLILRLAAAIPACASTVRPDDAGPQDAQAERIDLDIVVPTDVRRDSPADGALLPDVVEPPGSTSVAFQIDVAHTGFQPDVHLTLPLVHRWTRDLGGPTSYPVVAGGRVFVTVATGDQGATSVVALDAASGTAVWGPVALAGYGWTTALAYDEGRVFAVDATGTLRAIDAASGAVAWSIVLPMAPFSSSSPVAANGLVYFLSDSGFLTCLSEASGEVVWRSSLTTGGSNNPPALAEGVIYVSTGCYGVFASDAHTGTLAWAHRPSCSGDSTDTIAVSAHLIFSRETFTDGEILDTVTGMAMGTFHTNAIPALAAGMGYFLYNHALQATPMAPTMPAWSFVGDGALSTAPIVVGNDVVVGSSLGHLYVLSAASGALLDMETVPGLASSSESGNARPPVGFAAAEGMLFVPTNSGIVAFGAPAH